MLTPWVSVEVSGDLCRLGPALPSLLYSCHKTGSRLRTTISIVVHAKAVCAQKIHPIGTFFTHSLRSKINAPWKVSQFQKVSHFSINSDYLCRSRNSMIRTAPAWSIDGRNMLGWRKNECFILNISYVIKTQIFLFCVIVLNRMRV